MSSRLFDLHKDTVRLRFLIADGGRRSGILPRLMAWALVMIWLAAACRKTCVSRATGTRPLLIRSAKHIARPNGR